MSLLVEKAKLTPRMSRAQGPSVQVPNLDLHELFEEQVRRTPDRVALLFAEGEWTYAQLNERANRLAHALIAAGVKPGAAVGVSVHRGPELIAALLGVLKAGGGYVALEPRLPVQRLVYMARDAAVTAVIADEAGRAGLGYEAPLISVNRAFDTDLASTDPGQRVDSDSLAYILFTSGSTGTPKGVMLPRWAVRSHIAAMNQRLPVREDDVVLQKTPVGFDVSVPEIFQPLTSGARLAIAAPEADRDPRILASNLREFGVTDMRIVPTLLAELIDAGGLAGAERLRRVISAGEALTPVLRDRFFAVSDATLVNQWGPTEATVYGTVWECRRDGAKTTVPIGYPLDGKQLYVLDERFDITPVGVNGELFVGGAELALGYRNKPRQTALAFVPDAVGSGTGARLYRSGDTVRWSPAGWLEYLGRRDNQVQLRGIRVELGEVEMLLESAPGVQAAAVIARGLTDGRADDLVAYVVANEGVALDPAALRAHLGAHLADAVIPALFFELAQMPRTASGKIDRKALAGMGSRVRSADHVAPRSATEQAIAAVWCEHLGIEEIGVHDSFFEVGGQSLHAMRILRQLEDRFDRELPLSLLLESRTVAALAARLDMAQSSGGRPDIEHQAYGSEAPVSSEQRRMWFLQALSSEGVAYNEPLALELHGSLDPTALAAALTELAHRHEALRTIYPQRDGEPYQLILSDGVEVPVRIEDLADARNPELAVQELIETELKIPFQLDAELPFRAVLARLSDTRHVLLLLFHHIVVDEWMLRPLLQELGELYAARSEGRAPNLPPVRLQYADYALWQQEQLRDESVGAALEFWGSVLEGAPRTLPWPMGDEGGEQVHPAGTVHFEWSASTTRQLRSLARSLEMTDFEALHASFAAFLARFTGRPDLTLGVPVTMRQRPELHEVVGLLLNTVPARFRLRLDATFAECLRLGREQWRESAPHHWVPLDEIVRHVGRRGASESAVLFDTMFTYVPDDAVPERFGALRQERFDIRGLPEAKGAASLLMAQRDGHFTGALEFDSARFDRASVEAMIAQFERFVATSLREPDRGIGEQELLTPAERRVVDDWARGPESAVSSAPFHERFQAQVRATPDRVAIRFEGGQWTYRELDARSNQIASLLVARGVVPETPVGVSVERSPELIAALIGVMKAGGAYVALEPSLPVERLHYMVRDSGVRIVVCEAAAREALVDVVGELISVETPLDPGSASPAVAVAPSNLAYVLYTSGTTGLPKGVMIPHRALSNLAGSYAYDIYGLDPGGANEQRCFAVKASYTFDMFVAEVFPALVSGASIGIAPVDSEREPDRLVRALRDQEVTDLWATPTMVSMLAESGESLAGGSLRTVYCGGEALSASVADFVRNRWGAELWNLYGPTEMCVGQTAHRVAELHSASVVTIGRATPNHRVAVLGSTGDHVMPGVDGEIAIAGAGEGRGYSNLPRRTALAFVPSVLDGGAGERMYLTGDVGRWTDEGDIAYRGRSDNQLQVRGVRVELGEVEALLEQFPGVSKAIVAAVNSSAGRADSLVAYLVSSTDPAPTTSQLRDYLGRYLAAAVIPAGFVFVDEMPLLASGKVNRHALPTFGGEQTASQAFEEPATPTEKKLARIWSALLEREKIGRHDDFFELGGHSLLAMRLISRIRDTFGVQLKARDVFGHPTLSAMSLLIDQHAVESESDTEELVRAVQQLAPDKRRDFVQRLQDEGRELPLALFPLVRPSQQRASSAQERLWFLAQLDASAVSAYQIPLIVRMEGALDLDALAAALNGVIARHEILRTRLVESQGVALQVVDEALQIDLDVREVAHLTAQQVDALVVAEMERPIDLVQGPGLRAFVLRWSPTHHVFLIVVHHVLCDGWSADILMREISLLYDAAKSDADAAEQLSPLDVQYRDFANWQRYWNQTAEIEPQLAYWKQKLVELQPIALPLDRPRPPRASYRGQTITRVLPPQLAERFRALARQEGVTLFQALLAAYQALLARVSGQTSFGVGSPVAGRAQKELEPLIGLFLNMLVFRADVDGDPSFRQLLKRVKSTTLEAFDNQDVPLERLVAELEPVREAGRPPFFQTVFMLNDVGGSWFEGTGKLSDLELSPFPISVRIAKFDLTLTMFDRAEGLVSEFEFALDLFEPETIEAIAQQFQELVEAIVDEPDVALSEVSLRSEAEGPAPVSLEQRRLWLLQQTRPKDTAYNVPLALRLRGPLNANALRRALTALVARHDMLRTVCRPVGAKLNPHDVAVLEVLEPPQKIDWDVHQLRGDEDADAILSQLVARPFNLAVETPLRAALLNIGEEGHILALVLHHISVDEWSSEVLWTELDALYQAELSESDVPSLPPVPPYHEYSRWRASRSRGRSAVDSRAFWKDYLTGAEPDVEWPFAGQGPRTDYPAVEHVEFRLGTDVSSAIRNTASLAGLMPEVLLYAGFAAFLARLSAQSDLTIGIPVSNRSDAGMQDAVGFFLSTLPVRASVDFAASFEEWVEQFAREWACVVRHRWTPFEELAQLAGVRAQPGRPPLFDVMFIFVPPQELRSGVGALDASLVGPHLPHLGVAQAKAALTAGMFDDGEQFGGTFAFDASRFDRESFEEAASLFQRLLASWAANPAARMDQVSLVDEDQQRTLQKWSQGAEAEFADTPVHELFEAQVTRDPDALAVQFEGTRWSYRELNERANQIAHRLRRHGAGPDIPIGVLVERSPELVAAILGVLKAGAAYVPLEPSFPDERLRNIAERAGLGCVVTKGEAPQWVSELGAVVDVLDDSLRSEARDNPNMPVDPENLIYVMFTSGSTGVPKGVMVRHQSVTNHVGWIQRCYTIGPEDRMLQKSLYGFDMSVTELFAPLAGGGAIVLARPDGQKDPAYLVDVVRRQKITVLRVVPTALRLMVHEPGFEELTSLRWVMLGGEALTADLEAAFHRKLPGTLLVNPYGITETCVDVTYWDCQPGDAPNSAVPIGYPLDNYSVHIVDDHLRDLPVGMGGELLVGGPGCARGYLGAPATTALKFVPDPFSAHPGARLYASGDVGSWSQDGILQYRGRKDRQVQIRGNRIELDEIESRLLRHPAVKDAAVVAVGVSQGRADALAAYYVAEEPVPFDELRGHMARSLDAAVIPSWFVHLERMPRTSSGKVDRKALPEPHNQLDEDTFVAPRNETERRIAEIWCSLLNLERVGVHDNFFEVGGHSLLAVRLQRALEEELQRVIPLAQLLELPTIATFAEWVDTLDGDHRQSIPRHGYAEEVPVSSEQRRMWFLQKVRPDSVAYQVPLTVRLRGELDVEALELALSALVSRHEVLRTVYPTRDGEPVQRILPANVRLPLEIVDAASERDPEGVARGVVDERTRVVFDLENEPPLRATLVRLGEADHVLLLLFHHIAIDEWSTSLLFSELAQLYSTRREREGADLQPLELQYADYALWQAERLASDEAETGLAYWREHLSGAPHRVEWPIGHEPAPNDHRAALVRFDWSPSMSATFRDAVSRSNTTPFIALHAAFTAFLARFTGQRDVVVGVPVTLRERPELQELVGFLLNTVPLRSQIPLDATFSSWLAASHARWTESARHQWLPLDAIVRGVGTAQGGASPLFDTMFTFISNDESAPTWSSIEVGHFEFEGLPEAKTAMALSMSEQDGVLTGALEYESGRFDAAAMVEFVEQFRRFVSHCTQRPADPVMDLEILDEDAVARIATWSVGPCIENPASTFPELFERQVAAHPEALALHYEGTDWTYAQLDARVTALARRVRAVIPALGTPVGVSVERSDALVVALLAVLRAGGAYVALEPNLPEERLRYMASDSGVDVVVCDDAGREAFADSGLQLLEVSATDDPASSRPFDSPSIDPSHLAYILYTSGTTGRPKGVMIPHLALANITHSYGRHICGLGEDEDGEQQAHLVKGSYTFDLFVTELFPALAWGARVVVAPAGSERDPDALMRIVSRGGVTDVWATPTHLRMMLESRETPPKSLQRVYSGGEALTPEVCAEVARRWGVVVQNLYGPTEMCAGQTGFQVPRSGATVIPIGSPTPNHEVSVLDDTGRRRPGGVRGEITIAGLGEARGYRNMARQTARTFLPYPYASAPGSRMYCTGDRGQWNEQGFIEYFGRGDDQLQVRGVRVELADVEAHLCAVPGVGEAAVRAVDVRDGRADALVGYVVFDSGVELTPAQLRAHLAQHLVDSVIPTRFVTLESMPQMPSGKIDRHALPEPDQQLDSSTLVAPRNETERRIAEIWCHHLELDEVGVETNFFDAGGHSLLAVRVAHDLTEAFAIDFDLPQFFESPTIAEQAVLILERMAADIDLDEFDDLFADLGEDFE